MAKMLAELVLTIDFKGKEIPIDMAGRVMFTGLILVILGFMYSIIEAVRRGKEVIKPSKPEPKINITIVLDEELRSTLEKRRR